MYPPGPFFMSRGSYETSVDPPSTQPDADPRQAVCINQDWLPFIAGSLKQLLLQATWKVPNDTALLDVQGRVFNLIAMFEKLTPGCGLIFPPTKMCISGSFINEQYGYVAQTGFGCVNNWISGTGWQNCLNTGTGNKEIHIERDLTGVTTINSYSFHVNAGVGSPAYDITAIWAKGGATVRTDTTHITTGGGTLSVTANFDADHVIVESIVTSPTSLNQALDDWSMCYTGLFPLSEPPAPTQFDHLFNFVASNGGFTTETHPNYPNTGVYVGGTGWQSQTNTVFGPFDEVLIIHRLFGARTIQNLTLHWTTPVGANGGFRQMRLKSGGTVVAALPLNSGAGTFIESFNVAVVADEVEIIPTSANTGSSTQHLTVTSLEVLGLGPDPF